MHAHNYYIFLQYCRTGSYSGDRDKAGPRKRLIQIPSEHSTPVIRESFGKLYSYELLISKLVFHLNIQKMLQFTVKLMDGQNRVLDS